MKKVLFPMMVMFSLNIFAGEVSTEPKVNFSGVEVKITETCLSQDGQKLLTKEPVKLYAMVERAGKKVSSYVGSQVLETSLLYTVQGSCLRKLPKTGSCIERAPSQTRAYELDGTFEVSKYRQVAGKIKVKTSSESRVYSVGYCI